MALPKLAELLGISERRVNQLVNEEVLHREIEGDFVLTMAIASFYGNKYSSKDEDDYWSEKALHEAAKRKLAELELCGNKNLCMISADVERVMTDMLSKLRSQLLGIPAKMAARLENQSRSVIMTELSKEIKSQDLGLKIYNQEIFGSMKRDS